MKMTLIADIERLIKSQIFSDAKAEEVQIVKKIIEVKKRYLVIVLGGSNLKLSLILKNISLLLNDNYTILNLDNFLMSKEQIKAEIQDKSDAILILGEKAASIVLSREIDFSKARIKPFKLYNKEAMICSDYIDIDGNRGAKRDLWEDLKVFASYQNLEIKS